MAFVTLRRVPKGLSQEVGMRSAFCYLFEVAEVNNDYTDMVCEKHPKDAFIKRVVKALSENSFSRDALTTLFEKCLALFSANHI